MCAIVRPTELQTWGQHAMRNIRNTAILAGIAAALAATGGARADVEISSAATSNMICSGGVCSPTAATANLNTSDLENYLASGSLEVTTTGSGVQAGDIIIEAGFSWTNKSALALDAYHSLTFQSAVEVGGKGAVSLVTNDGGSGGALSFILGGSLSFRKTKNNLSIDGKSYKLASTLPALAADIAAKKSGNYALSASYDASQVGTYGNAPVKENFRGSFNGLGNTISNLSIHGTSRMLGLFANVEAGGSIASVRVMNAKVNAPKNSYAGIIAGVNSGTIVNSSAGGSISAKAGEKLGGGLRRICGGECRYVERNCSVHQYKCQWLRFNIRLCRRTRWN
jgi:hypothetical protein